MCASFGSSTSNVHQLGTDLSPGCPLLAALPPKSVGTESRSPCVLSFASANIDRGTTEPIRRVEPTFQHKLGRASARFEVLCASLNGDTCPSPAGDSSRKPIQHGWHLSLRTCFGTGDAVRIDNAHLMACSLLWVGASVNVSSALLAGSMASCTPFFVVGRYRGSQLLSGCSSQLMLSGAACGRLLSQLGRL